jgi:hypothetical protein
MEAQSISSKLARPECSDIQLYTIFAARHCEIRAAFVDILGNPHNTVAIQNFCLPESASESISLFANSKTLPVVMPRASRVIVTAKPAIWFAM